MDAGMLMMSTCMDKGNLFLNWIPPLHGSACQGPWLYKALETIKSISPTVTSAQASKMLYLETLPSNQTGSILEALVHLRIRGICFLLLCSFLKSQHITCMESKNLVRWFGKKKSPDIFDILGDNFRCNSISSIDPCHCQSVRFHSAC